MLIEKGQKLRVSNVRKGTFLAVASESFDTETTEWYPLEAAEFVEGRANVWAPGDEIPCRKCFVTRIELVH